MCQPAGVFARPIALAVLLTLVAGACASSGPDSGSGSTTTTVQPTAAAASLDDVRERFVIDAGADGVLEELDDTELGCVANALLAASGPEVVLSISRQGPKPHQAAMTVEALETCGVVEAVFRTGLAASMASDPHAPVIDPNCMLEGVTADHLSPILIAQFSRPGGVSAEGSAMDALLVDTPLMANLIRCPLEASGGLTPFCAGYLDVIDEVLRLVMDQETLGQASVDPVAYAALFDVTEGVFAWLATNVPADLGETAVLVHDAVIIVDEAFADAVAGMEDDGPEARDTALLAASSRIGAGLEGMNAAELPAATNRLRSHIAGACGVQATIVFDLFGGFGAGFTPGG